MPCSEYSIKVKFQKADARNPITLKTAILVVSEDKRQLCFYKVEPDGRKPFPNIPIISSENISSVRKTKSVGVLYTFDCVYQGDTYSATIQAPNYLLGEIHDICQEIFARSPRYGTASIKTEPKRRPKDNDILAPLTSDLAKRRRTDDVEKRSTVSVFSTAIEGLDEAQPSQVWAVTPASIAVPSQSPNTRTPLATLYNDNITVRKQLSSSFSSSSFRPMSSAGLGKSGMAIRKIHAGEHSPRTLTPKLHRDVAEISGMYKESPVNFRKSEIRDTSTPCTSARATAQTAAGTSHIDLLSSDDDDVIQPAQKPSPFRPKTSMATARRDSWELEFGDFKENKQTPLATPTTMSAATTSSARADVDESSIYGMPNVGNSCYVNAVLQVLFNLEFFEQLRTLMLPFATAAATRAPISASILAVYGSSIEQRRQRLESLTEKVHAMSELASKTQEDAHEFLVFLFDRFEQEMKALGRFTTDISTTPRRGYDWSTLVDTSFNHAITVVLRCAACPDAPEVKHVDRGNHLIIQPSTENYSSTITDHLLNVIDSDIPLKCSRCGQQMSKVKQYFDKFPKYIVLTLIRYTYDAGCRRKICAPIVASRQINFLSAIDPLRVYSQPLTARPADCGDTPKSTRIKALSPSVVSNSMQGMTLEAGLALSDAEFVNKSHEPFRKTREDDFLSDDEDFPPVNNPVPPLLSSSAKTTEAEPLTQDDIAAGDQENDEEELSILKESVPSPMKRIRYVPVGHAWRMRICRELLMEEHLIERSESVYELHRICDQRSLLIARNDKPIELADVPGDGNCLFSALSHVVTGGSDAAHALIREKICDFLEKHEKAFSRYVKEEDFTSYVQRMRRNSEWGSQAELFAFATLTETPIYTFFEGMWTSYAPRFVKQETSALFDSSRTTMNPVAPLANSEHDDREMVYLCNESLHFEPVLSMKHAVSYGIRGIVNHLGTSTENGHYTSILRKRDRRMRTEREKWLKCDDSTVREVGPEEALASCATSGYIFFYERLDKPTARPPEFL